MKNLKVISFILLLGSMVVLSCSKNNSTTLPVADFSASATVIHAGETINFTDMSTGNPTSWVWSFSGGTPASSVAQNPGSIKYNDTGIYSVTLTVTSADGSNSKTKTNYITVTNAIPVLPTITTSSISNITDTTAISGGTIINQGSSTVTTRGVCWSTNSNPTIADNITTDSSGVGSFSSNLKGLDSYTTYYVRAYATSGAGTAYGNELSFTTTGFPNCGTVSDIDGNVYHTVTIGTQCWMVENLRTTHYKDGTAIPNVTDNTEWGSLNTGAYCYYNNDVGYKSLYGALYNWYAVHTDKLAPAGWHVPTDAEWQILIDYLGGQSVAGGKMKATTLWSGANSGATNSSGFSGLPAGGRYYADFTFIYLGAFGNFWSSTQSSLAGYALYRVLDTNSASVTIGNYIQTQGWSVRCVKD